MDAIFFLLLAGFVLGFGVKCLLDKRRNDQQIRECVMAEVVSLRMENPIGRYGKGRYTCYYATFRLENENELIFSIPETEFERLAQGDRGELTFRGWQYLFFSRQG